MWLPTCLLGIVLSMGCGHRPPPVIESGPPEPPDRPLWVAAPPSARAVIQLRPVDLIQHEGARVLWDAFVDPTREQVFAKRTGVVPHELSEVLFIEYAAGQSYALIMRGPLDAPVAVRRAAGRLISVDVQVDAPRVRREGLGARGRWAYVALAPDTLLVARDVPPPELGRILQSYERGDSSLGTDALSLARDCMGQALAVLVPSPLALQGKDGAALLLAHETALAVVLRPEGQGFVASLDLRGAFPAGASENFRTLAHSLSVTQLGEALGLKAALPSLRVQQDDVGVNLTMRIPGGVLARGLQLLFFDELRRLFE